MEPLGASPFLTLSGGKKVNGTTCLFVGNYLRFTAEYNSRRSLARLLGHHAHPLHPTTGLYTLSAHSHSSITWPLSSLSSPLPFHTINVVVAPLLLYWRAILTHDRQGTCSQAFSTASPAIPLSSRRTTSSAKGGGTGRLAKASRKGPNRSSMSP
jgi:hypothetical protein